MNNFLRKHSEKIVGYSLISPAVILISLFGVFPVFFGMYMSVHKWKVFKGRFLGFENYERILGSIPAFFVFILGLLALILSYWIWSEFKDRYQFKQKIYVLISSLTILSIGIYLININWSIMVDQGDEDYLYALIYTLYYAFFTIIFEIGLGLVIAFALYQK